MTPDDRLAGLLSLAVMAFFAIVTTIVVSLTIDCIKQRPAVTRDPHTGKLYIPRSNLTVGQRRRRHHQR